MLRCTENGGSETLNNCDAEEAQVDQDDIYQVQCCYDFNGRLASWRDDVPNDTHKEAVEYCDAIGDGFFARQRLCTSGELQNECARANIYCDFVNVWNQGNDPLANLTGIGGNDVFKYVKFPLAYSFSQTQHGVETMDGTYEYANFDGKFPGEIVTVEGVWTMVS